MGGGLDCRGHFDTPRADWEFEVSPEDDTVNRLVSLPPLDIDPSSIVFAGFSSGSYMSMQMHIVHSETIKGVGLMAGGAFYTKGSGSMFMPRNWDSRTGEA